MQTQEIIIQTDLHPLSVVAIASCCPQQNAVLFPRCHCNEWCQVHPSHPARTGGTPLLAVPKNKSPPLPLAFLWPSLSREAAPFPVLLVTELLLSFAGQGLALLPLGFQRCVYPSSCCSCVPLCLSHFFTG